MSPPPSHCLTYQHDAFREASHEDVAPSMTSPSPSGNVVVVGSDGSSIISDRWPPQKPWITPPRIRINKQFVTAAVPHVLTFLLICIVFTTQQSRISTLERRIDQLAAQVLMIDEQLCHALPSSISYYCQEHILSVRLGTNWETIMIKLETVEGCKVFWLF